LFKELKNNDLYPGPGSYLTKNQAIPINQYSKIYDAGHITEQKEVSHQDKWDNFNILKAKFKFKLSIHINYYVSLYLNFAFKIL